MAKNNKKLIVLIIVILGVLILGFFTYKTLNKSDEISDSKDSSQNSSVRKDQNFILKDYPIEKVPLYNGSTVCSMKYFVNEDSTNVYDDFFDAKVNYYNVVFKADESKKAEILDFYKSMMSPINQDTSTENTIEGTVGIYRISISNYGYDDYYLQVHLPENLYSKQNKYYENYPDLVEIADDWVEYENTYGLLNQKGGEVEYTRWLEVDVSKYADDSLMKTNPISEYYKIYKNKYAQKQDFTADDTTGQLTWQDGDYEIWAVFNIDHGRVYLTFRSPMK